MNFHLEKKAHAEAKLVMATTSDGSDYAKLVDALYAIQSVMY